MFIHNLDKPHPDGVSHYANLATTMRWIPPKHAQRGKKKVDQAMVAQMMDLRRQGLSFAQIGLVCSVSHDTVRTHLKMSE